MAADVDALIRIEVARVLHLVVEEVGDAAITQFRAFAAGMDVGAKGDLTKVHKAIAQNAREAIQDAYIANVESVRKTDSYQRSSRLSGRLERVMRRRDLVRGDAEGVHFISESVLDKEAAHWRRMNFGAGGVAGPARESVPIRLFGETLARADFGLGPSPAFKLPKGFFLQGGGAVLPHPDYRGAGSVAPFVPSRRSPYRPAVTVGIRGRHFLEAGLDSVAYDFPIKYADLMQDWILRGSRKAKAIKRVVG